MVQARDTRQSGHRRLTAVSGAHDGATAAGALLVGKKPEATRHQAMVLQAAILAALRARNGTAVAGDGPRGEWRLKEATN
jgi:hypothetical protein